MHRHTERFGVKVSGVRNQAPHGPSAKEHQVIGGTPLSNEEAANILAQMGLPIIEGGAQTVAGLAPLLKEVYHPKMQKVIWEGDPTFTELKRRITSIEMDGSRYVWPMHTGRSASGRFMREQGVLPLARSQRGARLTADAYEVAQTITITRKSKNRSKTTRGSYVQSLPFEIQGAVADMQNRLNRACYGWGSAEGDTQLRTGKICRVQGVAGNVLTLGEGAADLATEAEMRYFGVDDITLNAIDPANGAARLNGTGGEIRNITDVDVAASTITLDDVTNIVAGDILVEGDDLDNAYDAEFPGLRVLINDRTHDDTEVQGASAPVVIHGQSAASYPVKWESQRVEGAVSDRLFVSSYRYIMTKAGAVREGSPDLVLASWEQVDELASQLTALRRYEGREVTLQTGWEGIKLSQGNLVPSTHCPTNDGFRINTSAMAWLVGAELDWDTDDGGEILLRSQNTLEYLGRYVGDLGLINLRRNAHARIKFDPIPEA